MQEPADVPGDEGAEVPAEASGDAHTEGSAEEPAGDRPPAPRRFQLRLGRLLGPGCRACGRSAPTQRAWLSRDITAGLVLTALLIPAGMGYAQAAGLPPIAGLYATILPLLAYALLGPSRILVLGPDSSLVPLIAAAVVPLAAGDEARSMELGALLALMPACSWRPPGWPRFGFVTDLLSHAGPPGLPQRHRAHRARSASSARYSGSRSRATASSELASWVTGLAEGLTQLRPPSRSGATCLATILLFRAWRPCIPGVLIAVVAATVVSYAFDLATRSRDRRDRAAAARPADVLAARPQHRRHQRPAPGGDQHRPGLLRRHERPLADVVGARRLQGGSEPGVHRRSVARTSPPACSAASRSAAAPRARRWRRRPAPGRSSRGWSGRWPSSPCSSSPRRCSPRCPRRRSGRWSSRPP